jgi:hypothetical protein
MTSRIALELHVHVFHQYSLKTIKKYTYLYCNVFDDRTYQWPGEWILNDRTYQWPGEWILNDRTYQWPGEWIIPMQLLYNMFSHWLNFAVKFTCH